MNYFWRRENLIVWFAVFSLAVGLILPWYRLPQESLSAFNTNLGIIFTVKVILILLVLFTVVFILKYKTNRRTRLICWSMLTAVMLFPYLITTWFPTISFLAKTYNTQVQFITNHAQRHFPDIQAQWKQTITLSPLEPVSSVQEFSISDHRIFQISALDRFLKDGLGYRQSFFVCVGKGWGITFISLIVILFGLYLKLPTAQINTFLQDMQLLLPVVGLLMFAIIFQLIGANIANYQLEISFAKGYYQQVVDISKSLTYWYPPLKGDEAFLVRWAKASFYSNQPDTGLVDFAKGLERYRAGELFEAERYFQEALSNSKEQFLIQGYLATTLSNEGVRYFNDQDRPQAVNVRKSATAANYFEQALQIFPGNLEALYNLMLANTVNGNFEGSASAAQEILDLQPNFQLIQPVLIAQSYLHLAWQEYRNGGSPVKAWKLYLKAIDRSEWKNSVEESQ